MDWLDEFMMTHTRISMTERIEIPDTGDVNIPPYITVEVVSAVSWRRLLELVEINHIKQADKYRVDFATATPKGRGRVAMNINNSLRGAARRRGGLYAMIEGTKLWHEAPASWLKVQVEQDFSEPSEDRDGNPL